MTFDILIPTYNRSNYLIKTIDQTCKIIDRLNDVDFRFIIVDNASPDDTEQAVNIFITEHPNHKIEYHRNDSNIGIMNNLIKIFYYTKADYSMILGDDDFLNYEYLAKAISYLKKDNSVTCILPAYEHVTEEGERMGFGRDLGLKTKMTEAGIDNVIENFQRSNQITGIILKNSNFYDLLKEKGVNNLYPHMFPVGYNCLNGKCIHIPEFPILVTRNSKKDWSYDMVGLVTDIFQNIKILLPKDIDRFKVEKNLIKQQSWRILNYYANPLKQITVITKISFHPNTSSRGHIFFPFIISGIVWKERYKPALKNKIKRLISR